MKNAIVYWFVLVANMFFAIGCMPDGARPLRDNPDAVLAYEYVKETWRNTPGISHKNLDDNVCGIDNIWYLYATDSEFKEYTDGNKTSCISHPDDPNCATAQWTLIRPRASLIIFADNVSDEYIRQTWYHELIHFFTWCTRENRDADHDHSNPLAWEHGIMRDAQIICRADYENVSDDERQIMIDNNIGVCPVR